MKFSSWVLATLSLFGGLNARAADNMASLAITPATGVVTLSPRWAIAPNLAGFHHMSQDLGLTGSVANNFYSLKAATIPSGGDILAFNFYVAGSGSATPHSDIGSKLTPSSYSALTSADPDVGYGSVNLYTIHHKGTTDYFTAIIPGSATSSAVTDEKPMSGPGGPGTVTGVSGYFGLTFAAANLGYGLNNFYYLRTDPVTGSTKFGTLAPALLGLSADQFDLGGSGHQALAFTGSDVGYGVNKMYYIRLDPVTGFTILGVLDPSLGAARHTYDIANLGSVFSTLTYEANDLGFGASRFYTTGTINATWQSISFAPIANRAISQGSFTVNPTASSALPITLTVVAGSTGTATISSPVGGVFTITPTGPGVVTLQASQAGAVAPTPFEANMLRQSFTVSGTGVPVITNSPLTAAGTVGAGLNFAINATNAPTVYSASPLPAGLSINTTTGVISGTSTAAGVTSVLLGATNASGAGNATLTITVAAAGTAPIITNSPLTAAGTVGTPFSFSMTASGSPTSYTATPLPAGLSIAAGTGVISGTPTAVGVTTVALTATNGSGTGNATLTITVAAAGSAPIITNNPLTAAGTTGTPFGYTVTASGTPTSFTATGLPAGLSIVATTGAITGMPSSAGVSIVTLSATNATGTGNATLTITVAAPAIPPIVTSAVTAPATVGSPFGPYQIAATSLPTTYAATGLPAGLTVNSLTGAITGTPTAAGVFIAPISATSNAGTGRATLTITVAAAGVPPILTSPTTTSGSVGTVFVTYQVVGTGLPTTYSASGLPAGLTINSLTGAINGTPTSAGISVATIRATNNAGTGSAVVTMTVAPTSSLPIVTSAPIATGSVGSAFVTYQIMATGNPTVFNANGLPPGLEINAITGRITGTPTNTGNFRTFVYATTDNGVGSDTLYITVTPGITTQPAANSGVAIGGTATFSVATNTGGNATTYQWKKDGIEVPGANSSTLIVNNVQPANAGFYTAVVSSFGTSTASVPASLGIEFVGQVAGGATVAGSGIRHANGNLYDQLLLTGPTASFKAFPGSIARLSFVDLSDDIVQVELSGAGVVSIRLDNATGPSAPTKYNQPGVLYMKGHASIAITGADATTNLSVFSVGRSNAVDQTLFPAGTVYDGYADIALLTIASSDGRFGGARTGNASYSHATGMAGVYAPGVQFSGPVYIEDIASANNSSSSLVLGSASDVRITGGDLSQDNGGDVEVRGISRLQFTAGTSSHGVALPVQANRGRLMTDGVDVTAQLVQ